MCTLITSVLNLSVGDLQRRMPMNMVHAFVSSQLAVFTCQLVEVQGDSDGTHTAFGIMHAVYSFGHLLCVPDSNVSVAGLPGEIWSHSADEHHACVLHKQLCLQLLRAEGRRSFRSALCGLLFLIPISLSVLGAVLNRQG